MTDFAKPGAQPEPSDDAPRRRRTRQPAGRRRRRKRLLQAGLAAVVLVVILGGAAAWLGFRAGQIKDNLQATAAQLPELKAQLLANDGPGAAVTVASLGAHTAVAKKAGADPLWKLASGLPLLGANFSAASEVATTADDVVRLAAVPMVGAFESLDWKALTPVAGAVSMDPLIRATPSVVSAANTVQLSYSRLAGIDTSRLLPQIAAPLNGARNQLNEVRGTLSVASDAAQLIPPMMGTDGPRNYLLLIQNNAEIRASGGIPGALALIHVENGKIQLTAQDSATALGSFSPPVGVDPSQETIYTGRIGTFMQDVNMTPDFPTAAATAKAMWEQRHSSEPVDGVISLDPVALSLVLKATGPIDMTVGMPEGLGSSGLPAKLTADNLVKTLLSDVYANVREPQLQDVYFAEVATRVFDAISAGKTSGEHLVQALGTGVADHRILLWSAKPDEQKALSPRTISGSISGPSVPAAGFGVYFNDGTGAKMDYYVKRTVQLVQRCSASGYAQYTARVKMTNTAPLDAAKSLPAYVTGDAVFGVERGSVATNVVAYGPAQARAQGARVDGQTAGLGSFTHAERPVGVIRVQLAPGESKTIEIDFSKVVQTGQAELEVTPTIEKRSDVVLPEEMASECR
ncbi:DUF4012 domain-containing protein [Arthrobacter sp. A5]|uniref:DUF4012 domain-containing protein n=1 Tax=Arthrobacter sp. A5 TaxID=576926 RepID=UPI003DAA1DF0